MADIPDDAVAESRAAVDEWAVQSRLLLMTEEEARWAAGCVADLVANLGHAGAARALTDAAYAASQFAKWFAARGGTPLDAQEALALLGMAGLVLADREAERHG